MSLALVAMASLACKDEPVTQISAIAPDPQTSAGTSDTELVGYDLRRLRPNESGLQEFFERMRARAIADGKRVAVLFSADWCEPCRQLDLELGNRHPARDIGDVRIFELKEEEWEAAMRLDEFNGLRARWYPEKWSYPVFVLLDEEGKKREEMREAIDRLNAAGLEPTLVHWFADLRKRT